MAGMTSEEIANRLRIEGIDPRGTNNPLGQYGMTNLDFMAASAMGFAEFGGDTASLPMGFDVLANRSLAPRRYMASSPALADIITARGPTGASQFDPFDENRGSPGGIQNRDKGFAAAINQIRTGDPGVTGNDRTHYDAILSSLAGVFGTGAQRHVSQGADMFVGRTGTHVNREMQGRMDSNGFFSAPGGTSRFFNYNETLGPDELGMGPAIGGPEGFPAFGPSDAPARPNEFKAPQGAVQTPSDPNAALPDIPWNPYVLTRLPPGIPGGGTPTPERPGSSFFGAGGYNSISGTGGGSRYNINANDPPPPPAPPPIPDPPWMGTPESRRANEEAGRIQSERNLADFRREQADRAAGGFVFNGREWVHGGRWTGREYIPSAPAAADINGFPTPPPVGWTFDGIKWVHGPASPPGSPPTAAPAPAPLPPEWITPTPWAPPPVPTFQPPEPTTGTAFAPVTPSFGNTSIFAPYGTPNGSLGGGSGVSPSTVGPSGSANPYGADPNFSNPGGQPRIGIIMPNTLF